MSTATLQERRASPPTTMHLVRAIVDAKELQRWMTERRITDRDYAMHSLLTESFDQTAPKPYRLVPAREGNEHLLYGYTQGHDAADLKLESAMSADPLQANIIPVDTIQSKTMPTDWPKDKTLGFEARVRPITRMKHLQETRKNATEIDRYALKVMQGKLPRQPTIHRYTPGSVHRVAPTAVRQIRRRQVAHRKHHYHQLQHQQRHQRTPPRPSQGPGRRHEGHTHNHKPRGLQDNALPRPRQTQGLRVRNAPSTPLPVNPSHTLDTNKASLHTGQGTDTRGGALSRRRAPLTPSRRDHRA